MILAVICGICGAIGSLFGKLAFSNNKIISKLETVLCIIVVDDSICYLISIVLRIISFILMILFNGLMVNSFLKSIRNYASVSVAVVSTASNYLATGFIGYIVLDENLSLYWFSGSILISIGLCLISMSQDGFHANQIKWATPSYSE